MTDDEVFFVSIVAKQIGSAKEAGVHEVYIASPTNNELDFLSDYGNLTFIKDETWKLKIYPSPFLDKEKSGE